jgi:hypothetical protein
VSDAGLRRVWVTGQRWNTDYLFDTRTGRVVTPVKLPCRSGKTAGVGNWCGRQFVAVYVGHDSEVYVQVGTRRMQVDGITAALHDAPLRGLRSKLTLVRPAFADITASLWLIGGNHDDYLADVADIVNTRERRDWLLEIKDPDAGPWLALS